jgi:AcrR family transcriptional regulator
MDEPQTEHESQGKRERTKLRNRSLILDAARDVFVDIGYDAATVRDIVARTKLAPGTFYNYFPDKRSVLLALVGQASREGGRLIREARARATTLAELVHEGFHAYFSFVANDRILFELMRRNSATLRTLGVDETGFAAGIAELHADLERAVAAGMIPPLPLMYMTRAVGAITFEIGAQMAKHDPPDVEGATRFATDVCLGALERLTKGAAEGAPAIRDAPARRSDEPRRASDASERAAPRAREERTTSTARASKARATADARQTSTRRAANVPGTPAKVKSR